MELKQTLRKALRDERTAYVAALPQATRALLFMRPPTPVAALAPEGSLVGLYYSTADEAPTRGYAKWLYENGRRLALPWFADRGAPMQFRLWDDPFADGGLEPAPYGLWQPNGAAEEVTPDVLFVPLLGFTAQGERMGQGGGHYDRWLSEHPEVKAIGMGWDCQLRDELPLELHDRQLAGVVTPTRFYQGEN